MNHQKTKSVTRKGAASFYVVIFAALVFTVIVLSFIRLMISESSQNTANDLSQSAYDSALAGVEDAKTALTRCLEQHSGEGLAALSSGGSCAGLFDSCTAISDAPYGTGNNVDGNVEQSYTCVKLTRDLENYKVNLSAERPTVVVPISANDGSNSKTVTIKWFSSLNRENASTNELFTNYENSTDFLKKGNQISPPVVSVGFIEQNNNHINTVILRPSSNGSSDQSNNDQTNNAQRAYKTANEQTNPNEKALIKCNADNDPACEVTITAARTIDYLVLNLPYNEEQQIGFTITKSGGSSNKFTEQIAVDSTGRANDYYRRVESRLQFADLNFPYPDYVLSAYGGNDANITKNFWVTHNCWNATNGSAHDCSNYGTV